MQTIITKLISNLVNSNFQQQILYIHTNTEDCTLDPTLTYTKTDLDRAIGQQLSAAEGAESLHGRDDGMDICREATSQSHSVRLIDGLQPTEQLPADGHELTRLPALRGPGPPSSCLLLVSVLARALMSSHYDTSTKSRCVKRERL